MNSLIVFINLIISFHLNEEIAKGGPVSEEGVVSEKGIISEGGTLSEGLKSFIDWQEDWQDLTCEASSGEEKISYLCLESMQKWGVALRSVIRACIDRENV